MTPVKVPQLKQCGNCSKFDDCPVSSFDNMKVAGKPYTYEGVKYVKIACSEYEKEGKNAVTV